MTPLSDLLKNAVEGDREALSALLERSAPRLRQGLVNQIPQRWQAVLTEEDVIQQTFADAFRDIHKFVPRGADSFAGWLLTLAKRNLLDAIKMLEAEKRGGDRQRVEVPRSEESIVALHEVLARTSGTPSRHVAREEAVAVLSRAIRQLPDAYRQVVEMYDLEGLEMEEVGKAMNRSTGAVSMLRARARKRLQEIMGMSSDYLTS